jgi:hypothetical protein
MKIEACIYSYKNKNLKLIVDNLILKTKNKIFINIFDQNTIDRSELFQTENVKYTYVFWDKIESPSEKKGNIINKSNADYILELSDDCLVFDNWDVELIDFIEKNNCVISGKDSVCLFKDTAFSYGTKFEQSQEIKITNYIVRDFIFSKNSIWKSVQYPYFLKYNGEQEMLSLNFFKAGYDIYCSSSKTYDDLGLKTIDSLYVPYSKDHNYNLVVESLNEPLQNLKNEKRTAKDFFFFHKITNPKISPLPYDTNDVLYDPYRLEFQDVDARKFIAKVNSIS